MWDQADIERGKRNVELSQRPATSEPLNHISEDEIIRQGKINTCICCDECDYSTGMLTLSQAVFKVNMQGGYFMYDGSGGPISRCPSCGLDQLVATD